MKRALALGLPGVLFGGLVTITTLSTTAVPPTSGASTGMCLPGLASGGHQAQHLGPAQQGNAQRIIAAAQQRHLPPRASQVALQAALTESHMTNVAGGDRDSIGLFQMRPSANWGTPDELGNVDYQINKFYDVLQSTPDWERLVPGEAAQRVERSAFPGRYHQVEQTAATLLSHVGVDPSGCGSGGNGGQKPQVVAFANAQLGKPYAWGSQGPDAWDCSSLVRAAWQQAGIALPRVSQDQYGAGQHVPVAQAQPGDLVFWGSGHNPAAIHHVGLYLGDGRVLHAPDVGQPVKVSPLWDGGELVPTATRPA